MKWRALATDFDGTIATDAVVDEPTLAALGRLRSANVRTLLVTGRHLTDFEPMGSFLALFDIVVGENGAVLFEPATAHFARSLLRHLRSSSTSFLAAKSPRWGLGTPSLIHVNHITLLFSR